MSFEIGDVVSPTDETNFILRSGCEYYDHAIVVKVDPFVLVSCHGDMRWGYTIDPKNFKKIGNADEKTLKICMRRLID